MSPTHSISLTVTVSGPEMWEDVYTVLSKYMVNLGKECPNATLSSYVLDEEETYNEETMAKVRVSLREVGVPEVIIVQAINSMQNSGILFRERD